MPSSCDRSYHEWRAREELEHADKATDPGIAMIHRELAAMHRRRMMALVGDGDSVKHVSKPRPIGPGR